jgi:hypothetical protein
MVWLPYAYGLEVILGFSKIRAREERTTFDLFNMFYCEHLMIILLADACG